MAKSQMNGARNSPLMQEWSDAMKIEMTAKEFAEYTKYLDRRKPKLSREWLDLRKEITNYCHSHKTMSRSFSTQQNFIYGAIRFVTGISQIDQLKGSQVDLARMVFHELVEKRENFSNEIN